MEQNDKEKVFSGAGPGAVADGARMGGGHGRDRRTTANTYTHTYHTKVDAKATFHLKNGSTYEISHDSGFVVGNLSDDAVQSQIKVFYDRVAAYLAEDGIGLSKISCTEKNGF